LFESVGLGWEKREIRGWRERKRERVRAGEGRGGVRAVLIRVSGCDSLM